MPDANYESGFFACLEAKASGQSTTADQAIAAWRAYSGQQNVTWGTGVVIPAASKFFAGWSHAR